MDKRLQKIVENYEKFKIGVDEPFRFHCTMCGACCIDRKDILLSAADIFGIARELGFEIEKVIKRFCEVYIGDSSRIPVVRLLPRGENQRCPFLQGKKCGVHNTKPAICAMFPVGRCIKFDSEQSLQDAKTEFILQEINCGNNSETHTVREWLNDFGIPIEDPCFLTWHRALAEISKVIRKYEKTMGEKTLMHMENFLFSILYLHYDLKKDFLPQLEANTINAIAIIKEFDQAAEALNELAHTSELANECDNTDSSNDS